MTNAADTPAVPAGVTLECDIGYREGDSEAWKLDLAMPTDRSGAPRPGVVFIHGGGWQGNNTKHEYRESILRHAALGYVCISVEYRLVYESLYPAAIKDVKCATRWFRANADRYHVDPDHIAALGGSAGGHMAAMLGLTVPGDGFDDEGPHQDVSSAVSCVVDVCGPTDIAAIMQSGQTAAPEVFEMFLAGPAETLAARQRAASPITYVRGDAPPFLVIHGTADEAVPVSQSDRFVETLKQSGAQDVTYIRVDDAPHDVDNYTREAYYAAVDAFFERTLLQAVPA